VEKAMAQQRLAGGSVPAVFKSRLRMKHLELFRNLCELHSLRKAAEASSMTQPAATKLIQELESMFGVPLFERDRRGMRPNAHGDLIKRHFNVVMSDVGHMCDELALYASGGAGVVRLGIVPSLSAQLLARITDDLLSAHPNVRLELTEGATDRLMEGLRRNDLDLIFGRILDRARISELRVVEVYTESFEVVSAAGHPLARKARVSWEDLSQARWILPATGSPLRDMAEQLFTGRGILRPVVSVEYSSFHQMRYVIAGSQLIGLLPTSVALQGEAQGDIARLSPAERARFAPISLISRQDFEQPPVVRQFEAIVLRAARDLGQA